MASRSPQQPPRRGIVRKGLDDPLRRPCSGGVSGDRQVNDSATVAIKFWRPTGSIWVDPKEKIVGLLMVQTSNRETDLDVENAVMQAIVAQPGSRHALARLLNTTDLGVPGASENPAHHTLGTTKGHQKR